MLELKCTIGKKVVCNNPGGSKSKWEVIDEVRTYEENYENKILILQKLQNSDRKDMFMYRFGYYILGIKPSRRGNWLWGQFAPFIGESDFLQLLKCAYQKGWFVNSKHLFAL